MASAQGSEGTSTAADPAREFLGFWANYFQQTALQTRILFDSLEGAKPLDSSHRQWIETLTESLDRFMRTPAFLDMLKQTLRQMVELKQLQNQATQAIATQAGLPRAAEPVGVLERIQSAELTILKRLDAVDDRLHAIETRLGLVPAGQSSERGEGS
jgi:hypothetical protein